MQPLVWREVMLDIVMFPIWWYSKGLVLMLGWCRGTLVAYAKYLAIGIWIKNIFVPMFGQNDWQSRLISVFMRSVQIVGRGAALLFIAGGLVGAAAVYIVAPMAVALLAAYNVIGSLLYVA